MDVTEAEDEWPSVRPSCSDPDWGSAAPLSVESAAHLADSGTPVLELVVEQDQRSCCQSTKTGNYTVELIFSITLTSGGGAP